MNKVILSGNISKDIVPNGSNKIGTTQICVAREYPYNKDKNVKEVVDFITIKFLGEKNVIKAAEWIKKGSSIIVEGRWQREQAKKEDGTWMVYDYLVVQKWEFQHGIKDKEKDDAVIPAEPQEEKKSSGPSLQAPDGYVMNIDVDDDLPFMK